MKINNKWLLLAFALTLSAVFLVSSVHATGIDGGYVGTDTCLGCHDGTDASDKTSFIQAGHSYKVRSTKGKIPYDDGTCIPGTISGTKICEPIPAIYLNDTPDVTALYATGVNGESNANLGVPSTGRLPWANIAYTIGGYMSKIRWGVLDTAGVGTNNTGYVWSSTLSSNSNDGKGAQFNFEQTSDSTMQDWSAYGDAGKKYDCAVCHNTNGAVDTGNQCGTSGNGLGTRDKPWNNGLGVSPAAKGGFYNEWTFDGVQCEACHGKGSNGTNDGHADGTGTQKVLAITGYNAAGMITTSISTGANYKTELAGKVEICAQCHIRGNNTTTPGKEWGCANDGAIKNGAVASGNWISHHEQYNELVGVNGDGAHASLACTDCHNPHVRAHKVTNNVATALGITDNNLSAEARGAVVSCESCHPGKTLRYYMYDIKCIDCHMGQATKSGPANGEVGTWGKRADVKTHIFKVDPTSTSLTRTNSDGKTVAKSALSVDYACGKCHDYTMSGSDGTTTGTREYYQSRAVNIHLDTAPVPATRFSITVSGLPTGTKIILKKNGATKKVVTGTGALFSNLKPSDKYKVKVYKKGTTLTCSTTSPVNSGNPVNVTIGSADVTVTCP